MSLATKSAKMADGPIFYNDKTKDTVTFEVWYHQIENKLEVNADHFPTERAKWPSFDMDYFESLFGGTSEASFDDPFGGLAFNEATHSLQDDLQGEEGVPGPAANTVPTLPEAHTPPVLDQQSSKRKATVEKPASDKPKRKYTKKAAGTVPANPSPLRAMSLPASQRSDGSPAPISPTQQHEVYPSQSTRKTNNSPLLVSGSQQTTELVISSLVDIVVSEVADTGCIFGQPLEGGCDDAKRLEDDGTIRAKALDVITASSNETYRSDTGVALTICTKVLMGAVQEAATFGTAFGRPFIAGELSQADIREARANIATKLKYLRDTFSQNMNESRTRRLFSHETDHGYFDRESLHSASPATRFDTAPGSRMEARHQPAPMSASNSSMGFGGSMPVQQQLEPADLQVQQPPSKAPSDQLPQLDELAPKKTDTAQKKRRTSSTGQAKNIPPVRYDFATNKFTLNIVLNGAYQEHLLTESPAHRLKVNAFLDGLASHGIPRPREFILELEKSVEDNIARLKNEQFGGFLS
ncbi:hypothetical protein QBC47DRAFT_414291 [Echria macrotheca]|uniref:Uncharacterized protein n=1 Tax=Echria macrotheca TaxID=438768 RepID=A0AAJ0FAJ6_9PEZI|nr:hypothetical protein QBC47DRAFT_414291 [Echria macrotheca]